MVPESAFSYAHLRALATNRAICDYLDEFKPHAHSDVGACLFDAAAGLNCAYFSPNIQQYHYVVLHTLAGVIFAGAAGMRTMLFHLPANLHAAALAEGGMLFDGLAEWVEFNPFDANVKTAVMNERIARWCHVAYESVWAIGPGMEK